MNTADVNPADTPDFVAAAAEHEATCPRWAAGEPCETCRYLAATQAGERADRVALALLVAGETS